MSCCRIRNFNCGLHGADSTIAILMFPHRHIESFCFFKDKLYHSGGIAADQYVLKSPSDTRPAFAPKWSVDLHIGLFKRVIIIDSCLPV